jgi:hypothetical protein
MASHPGPGEQSRAVTPDEARLLIQLHCVEYQMLMTQISTRTTLQFSLWGGLVLYVTLAARAPEVLHHPTLVAWGSVFVAQIFVLFWIHWQADIYEILDYIADKLAPQLISPLVESAEFWNYTVTLERVGKGDTWWEWMPIIVALLAVALGFYRDLHRTSDWRVCVGLGVNALMFIFLVGRFRVMKKARKKLSG